jgi:hypothetical protein
MVLHRNLLGFLEGANHGRNCAGPQFNKGMAPDAVEPVTVGQGSSICALYRRVIPFSTVFGAVENKGFCKALFFQVVEGPVHRSLVTAEAEFLMNRRCRKGFLGLL